MWKAKYSQYMLWLHCSHPPPVILPLLFCFTGSDPNPVVFIFSSCIHFLNCTTPLLTFCPHRYLECSFCLSKTFPSPSSDFLFALSASPPFFNSSDSIFYYPCILSYLDCESVGVDFSVLQLYFYSAYSFMCLINLPHRYCSHFMVYFFCTLESEK